MAFVDHRARVSKIDLNLPGSSVISKFTRHVFKFAGAFRSDLCLLALGVVLGIWRKALRLEDKGYSACSWYDFELLAFLQAQAVLLF